MNTVTSVKVLSKEEFREKTLEVFIGCMRYELTGKRLEYELIELIDSKMLGILLRLSADHDVVAFIADALAEHGVIDDKSEIGKRFIGLMYKSVIRYDEMNSLANRISDELEKNEIPHVKLKGETLGRYYPNPKYRKSCDIDILVDKEMLDKAADVLCSIGLQRGRMGSHDIGFSDSNGNKVELHYTLIEDSFSFFDISERVIENTFLLDGRRYTYELTPQMKYAYIVAHTAKHFKFGGCGMRSLSDLYVCKRAHIEELAEIDKMLERYGIAQFEKGFSELAYVWFEQGEKSEFTDQMTFFVLRGGVFGTKEQMIAVRRGKENKLTYYRKRIFLPYVELKQLYPKLDKRPYLTPAYELYRWITALSDRKRSRAIRREIKLQSDISDADFKQAEELCRHLGI